MSHRAVTSAAVDTSGLLFVGRPAIDSLRAVINQINNKHALTYTRRH